MSEIRSIEFPEKDRPLRDDVSMLGQLLGEVLVEQHGQQLLEQVETVRRAAILRREGDPEGAQTLEQALAALDTARLRLVIKAFSSYLRLANLAERVHRIRRNRTYLKQPGQPQKGSLEAVLGELRAAGVAAADVLETLKQLRIQPVFTAHPTEAARRSILQKEYSIIHRLVERLNPDRTPAEEAQALARIRDAVTSGWQTRNVAHARPTVADELDNVLFYVTEILYRVVPAFDEALHGAIARTLGEKLPDNACGELLRFGSWVGGDMDGNPNVTSTTILETLVSQREAVIGRYLPETAKLARYLSQTRGDAGILPELEARLERYAGEQPERMQAIPRRHLDMPYRCFLQLIAGRLRATLENGPMAYDTPLEFQNDIALIARSLEANKGEHAGMFGVHRLLTRVRAFGFHLATLDIRQDAEHHRRVMAELLDRGDWMGLDAQARGQLLEGLLASGTLTGADLPADLSTTAVETLAVFRSISDGRRRYGEVAIGLYIISMTQGADDVLTALALAHMAGYAEGAVVPLDIAPLLETVDDLEAGPAILEQLLDSAVYRQHLEQRGGRQVVMVGYSDSNKDSGIAASRWGLQQAQYRLAQLGRARGVEVVFFHGRGGTVSRGGGNLVNGIAGSPARTVSGYLRVTEQGEVINQKYGMRPLALRNLELVTGAVLQHRLTDVGQHADAAMRTLMQQLASMARRRYRTLVHEDRQFVEFFRSATPIDVIERLNIGSRPAARRSGQGIANLRAIPWVFAWAQVRVGLPGVFGVGTALDSMARQHGMDTLRGLYERWSFFRGMVNDVEMVLAKSELEIGARYAQLADGGLQELFSEIAAEFDLATARILELKGSEYLLQDQPTLHRNIRLRNPYVDPMHIVQIDLLRRWRASGREDDELLGALKATVSGIALGIQNTG
jgi:phosphoenolpyruvate carboxylase